MRIAYFSPLNPKPTGVSDYSEELLPALAELAEVDVFVDDYEPANPEITQRLPVYSYRRYEELAARQHYDVNLYQMGNSIYHAYIYEMLLRHPGVTVLHDVVLHHFLAEAFLYKGNPARYLREVAYGHGIDGVRAGHKLIHGKPISLFDYPAFHRAVDASIGLLVHSEYAANVVRTARSCARVERVPMVMTLPEQVDGSAIRQQLGIDTHQLVVGSFGRITPPKRLDVALRAFSQLRRYYPDSVYLLVGEIAPESRIDDIVIELGIETSVRRIGFVPDLAQFSRYVAACDICVNLRYPTAGETSAAALRLFSLGRPTIVSDVDAFSELPDNCCLKVPVGPEEEQQLARNLLQLAGDPRVRMHLGIQARELIARDHRPNIVARRYLTALTRLTLRRSETTIVDLVVGEMQQAIAELELRRHGFLAKSMESSDPYGLKQGLHELGLTAAT